MMGEDEYKYLVYRNETSFIIYYYTIGVYCEKLYLQVPKGDLSTLNSWSL